MKSRITGFIAFCLIAGTLQAAKAEPLLKDSGPTVSGTLDYYSSYMWRGQALDKDPVFQPGITLAYKGLSVGYWSSMAVTDRDSSGPSNEVDMTVSYSFTVGKLGLSLGHISYEFPSTGFAGTKEVFLGVAVNELPFSLGANYYSDYDDVDGVKGTYSLLSLGKGIGSVGSLPVNLSLSYGVYGDYGAFKNGSVITVGVGSSLELNGKLTATPSVYYVSTSGDLADEAIGNQKGGIYGGVSLAF